MRRIWLTPAMVCAMVLGNGVGFAQSSSDTGGTAGDQTDTYRSESTTPSSTKKHHGKTHHKAKHGAGETRSTTGGKSGTEGSSGSTMGTGGAGGAGSSGGAGGSTAPSRTGTETGTSTTP